ncbi:MAG TPA: hypothetical protein GXZ43_00750 [Clostridiaceae bacterium]|nr:hypothetical protein [Clostridiaceae bacterium]
MNNYIALIADIKKSRQSRNGTFTQEKFLEIIDKINKKYENSISSNFTINSGDSFQGLLHNGNEIMEILIDLELELHPLKIRFGMGIGSIYTAIYKENSNLIDGEAYHIARNNLEQIKESEKKKERVITNYKIGKMNNDLSLINSLFSLISIIKERWSENQVQVIKAYIENNYQQQKTAEQLGKAQSTISRSLESSQFYSLKNSFKVLNEYIEKERK